MSSKLKSCSQVTCANNRVRVAVNKKIIKIIITTLKGQKQNPQLKDGFRYLLNQAIRQYVILPGNWHLSVGAEMVWNSLTTYDIENCSYKELFRCDKVSGNTFTINGQSIALNKNKSMVFNSLFIAEHTTTVVDIIAQLEALAPNQLNESSVRGILDGIHITRMLKSEEEKIPSKYKQHRIGNFSTIVQNVYNPVGIKLAY